LTSLMVQADGPTILSLVVTGLSKRPEIFSFYLFQILLVSALG
jgi:hypothetical protein